MYFKASRALGLIDRNSRYERTNVKEKQAFDRKSTKAFLLIAVS